MLPGCFRQLLWKQFISIPETKLEYSIHFKSFQNLPAAKYLARPLIVIDRESHFLNAPTLKLSVSVKLQTTLG